MMVRFEPTGTIVLQNTLSLTRQTFYPIYSTAESASIGRYNSSSYYKAAEVQDYNYALTAFRRRTFEGTKISAAGYNVNSADLPDNSPVISIKIVNPGTIRNNPSIPVLTLPRQTGNISVTNPNSNNRNSRGYSSQGFNIG